MTQHPIRTLKRAGFETCAHARSRRRRAHGPARALACTLAAALVTTALLTSAPIPAHADIAAGWDAYTAGDHRRAEREWLPLAKAGNRDAAFGLGMLSQVIGKPEQAAAWYEQAAKSGLTAAQVLLGAMYADGRGVARDPIRAMAWLTLAVAEGHPNATLARDAVAAQLSDAEMAEAKALSATLLGD